jgi:hypothetical protein
MSPRLILIAIPAVDAFAKGIRRWQTELVIVGVRRRVRQPGGLDTKATEPERTHGHRLQDISPSTAAVGAG